MLVKATKLGYYNHKRVKEGTIFRLLPAVKVKEDGSKKEISAEEQFSSRWMEKYVKPVVDDPELEELNQAEAAPVKKKWSPPVKAKANVDVI